MTVTDPGPGTHGDSPDASGFEPLISTTVSDRCSQCGSEMAADQRYCVECGTRRGRARFSLPAAASARSVETVSTVSGVPAADPVRTISSSVALLGTIALLLLAMGVGVLIGNSGHGSTAPKVTVYGGGGSGNASGSAPAASGAAAATNTPASKPSPKSASAKHASSGSSPSSGSAATSAGGTLHPTAPSPSSLHTKAQRKAAEASVIKKTVPLKNGKKLAPENQQLGGKCSAGTVGCVNGKYTGQYF